MAFDFRWDDDAKTIMRYEAIGGWNWNDFHKHMRRSLLRFDEVSHPIDVIIDLRAGDKLPAGAIGHLRSIGTKAHTNSTGRAVILGVGADVQRMLGVQDGIYADAERLLYFADTDAQAYERIATWWAQG